MAHSLSLSYLNFHLIKVYIYVKLLVHWMCQWSECTLIIYKYALILYIYIYIYKNFIWFFFKKNYIRKKKRHVRGGSIPCYGCMLPPSHKLVEPTSMRKHEILPSGTFVEPLSFKLPSHQSLHLYKTFNSLTCQWSEYTFIIYKYAPIIYIYIRILYGLDRKSVV